MSNGMLRDNLLREMSGVPAVVMDCGTSLSRIGYSSSTQPHTVMRTLVGRPRVPSNKVRALVGEDAYAMRGAMSVKHPVEYGCITNWDDMELVWSTMIFERLQAQPENHPFLIVEEPLLPGMNREKAAQVLFETFEVPSLCMVPSPEACLFATNRRTGMVVEIGGGCCLPTPVVEGYCLTRHILKTLLSGRDLSYHMISLLDKSTALKAADYNHHFSMQVAEDIKDTLCYVAMDYKTEEETFSCQQEKMYELPDGIEIKIGRERYRCPEAIFQPTLMSNEMPGLHETVFNSISRCDKDLKDELFSNILLCGGSSLFPGLASRLQKEISSLAGAKTTVQVIASPKPHLAFEGASMIASRDDFLLRSLSKEFYDEYGPSAVTSIFFQW